MPDESIPLSVIVGELSSSHVTLMFGSGILVYNIKYQIIMAPIQVLFYRADVSVAGVFNGSELISLELGLHGF